MQALNGIDASQVDRFLSILKLCFDSDGVPLTVEKAQKRFSGQDFEPSPEQISLALEDLRQRGAVQLYEGGAQPGYQKLDWEKA